MNETQLPPKAETPTGQKALKDFTLGERVILVRSSGGGRWKNREPEKIDHVTPKRFRIRATCFDRATGQTVSGLCHRLGFESYHAEIPLAGELETYDQKKAEQKIEQDRITKEKADREATEEFRIAEQLSWIGLEKWEAMPLVTLRNIAAIAGISVPAASDSSNASS